MSHDQAEPFEPADAMVVSGRYTYAPSGNAAGASLTVTLRVDVDSDQALSCLSVEVSRRFPPALVHGVASVTDDARIPGEGRRVEAAIDWLAGERNLLPGRRLMFESGPDDTSWLSFPDRPELGRYPLVFESPCFDHVEFEVDRVENAGPAITAYHTASHPNRPADLDEERLTIESVYRDAGFDVSMSAERSVIPVADAGADGSWSDTELHNAMVAYWSRYTDRPQWAMWVLYAAQHDRGAELGGVMFDDIGQHHRQGTAIFTDSFVRYPPPDDPAPEAWAERMVFWTAIHEIGHGFNLAHSWQKALETPLGNPWLPLRDQPEARSFMNYPFNVVGGEAAYFADFEFRFTREELLFMRHAPREFVRMGSSDWFENHGLEAPDAPPGDGGWEFRIRLNRSANTFAFLEPVVLEFRLTNGCGTSRPVDRQLLNNGHLLVLVQREGRRSRTWRPMMVRCTQPDTVDLGAGESLYGAQLISASSEGWLIDEPGFYKVRAALDKNGQVLVSNVLRLYVATPSRKDENRLAPDYFTEDTARALAFRGAPALPGAMSVLQELADRCPRNPAAIHAALTVSSPALRDYKLLESSDDGQGLVVRTHRARVHDGAAIQSRVLMEAASRAASTIGHVPYFQALETLSDCLYRDGDTAAARDVLTSSLRTMKKRFILESVIRATEDRLARMS